MTYRCNLISDPSMHVELHFDTVTLDDAGEYSDFVTCFYAFLDGLVENEIHYVMEEDAYYSVDWFTFDYNLDGVLTTHEFVVFPDELYSDEEDDVMDTLPRHFGTTYDI